MYFFKSHTFYFKSVPSYLPKERGETSHSAWRGFSPGNPHVSFACTADVAQSCLSGDLYKHITMFDSNPPPQKFPEKLPRSTRFLIFPIGCTAFERSANYINTQIQTHQNRQCPEAPAAGKQTSSLNNPGREAREVREHPWATSHCRQPCWDQLMSLIRVQVPGLQRDRDWPEGVMPWRRCSATAHCQRDKGPCYCSKEQGSSYRN